MFEPEAQIFDLFPLLREHFLVTGLDIKAFFPQVGAVEVVGIPEILEIIPHTELRQGIFEKWSVVCLEPEVLSGFQDLFVHVHKPRTGKPAFHIALAGPGVGKGQPDLVDLAVFEETLDVEDLGPEKSDVGQGLFDSQRASLPKPVSFHVYADEVAFGEPAGKSYGILSPAARQLDGDGLVVLEIQVIPVALDPVEHVLAALQHVVAGSNDVETM